MAANAYKTQTGTPDKVIVELLIYIYKVKYWFGLDQPPNPHPSLGSGRIL